MQEIQKRDDHLDFLTSQAEEFQRENAELREKMNIIENILVTRAAESAAAQAATAVSTAVTANSLEPAASAAQMGLQTLGEIPEGDGSRGAPVVVENMSENPARLGHGLAQGGVAGALSPPALDVHMTASPHFAGPTVMGPQPTPPPHPTTPQATSPCFGVLEGLRGALTGLGGVDSRGVLPPTLENSNPPCQNIAPLTAENIRSLGIQNAKVLKLKTPFQREGDFTFETQTRRSRIGPADENPFQIPGWGEMTLPLGSAFPEPPVRPISMFCSGGRGVCFPTWAGLGLEPTLLPLLFPKLSTARAFPETLKIYLVSAVIGRSI